MFRLKDRFVDTMIAVRNRSSWLGSAMLFMIIVIVCLYYPIGMILVHRIDDNPNFSAGQFDVKDGSHTVAIAAALIDQEINHNHWVPNDPFFEPGSMLDRMPAYQRGIQQALARFAISISDQLGRVRGSSQIDPDLQKAVSLLNYSPNVWLFDFSISLFPTTSSEKQYRSAMKALLNYNNRIASGQAIFERRSDNLMETLTRIATDMGSSSAAIDDHIRTYSGNLLDTNADVLFYETKGKMYAYYLILRELKRDYADVIAEKKLDATWDKAVASFREGAQLSHFFVFNASPNSQFFPNHLTMQGFYLVNSRTQIFEITNILLK